MVTGTTVRGSSLIVSSATFRLSAVRLSSPSRAAVRHVRLRTDGVYPGRYTRDVYREVLYPPWYPGYSTQHDSLSPKVPGRLLFLHDSLSPKVFPSCILFLTVLHLSDSSGQSGVPARTDSSEWDRNSRNKPGITWQKGRITSCIDGTLPKGVKR